MVYPTPMHWPDVTELQTFYNTRLGQVATHSLRRAVLKLWPEAKGETLLGIGYPLPCLRPFLKSADIVCAAMPAGQGVIHWPRRGQETNLSLMTHDSLLPLRSGTQNRILMLHALEHAQPIADMLREVDRVLTPSGRALIITPNRRSLWARAEHTPYAQGQPYSMPQLKHLLEKHGFHVLRSSEALFFPPFTSRAILKFARMFERFGSRFFPHFGGALLVEVEKRQPAKISGTPVKAFVNVGKTATSLHRKPLS